MSETDFQCSLKQNVDTYILLLRNCQLKKYAHVLPMRANKRNQMLRKLYEEAVD